jgi:hypothetical protein
VKNITLAVLLVVMVATPCFTQELETDGLFSIEGTLWRGCYMYLSTSEPFINIECFLREGGMGFYEGKVYVCSSTDNDNCINLFGFYSELLVLCLLNNLNK